ncbi:hypothetical protein HYV84_08020 [Candidatus Woesearchaeota archaeon]|nr:hypothetical protein [Candidatus Woesearchaeota archaeon]
MDDAKFFDTYWKFQEAAKGELEGTYSDPKRFVQTIFNLLDVVNKELRLGSRQLKEEPKIFILAKATGRLAAILKNGLVANNPPLWDALEKRKGEIEIAFREITASLKLFSGVLPLKIMKKWLFEIEEGGFSRLPTEQRSLAKRMVWVLLERWM